MLLRKTYYLLKPILPWKLRVGLRQWRGSLKRRTHQSTWPISPTSALRPKDWPGWPDGKRFAVVLTHDVESALGVERTPALARLEQECGFRSSFNFVPEGYVTPAEVRQKLVADGFEVGVHGLKHDGKLYSSREVFRERALRINEYLKQWGAVGFRSPFMHHNLEWIHDLEILYDASTFDTDPFEPQPDGEDTIFPFWVDGGPGRKGYLEMPYTLVQDFTLFTILNEKSIDAWRTKLDWLVAQGGMVLLNVHPDYVDFSGNAEAPPGQFPAALYRELLDYIRTRYAGQYWHGLPKDLATYCAAFKPARPVKSGRRVCMISYSHYESDMRILSYARALVERGDSVEVLSLGGAGNRPRRELHENAWISRLQDRAHNESSKWDYLGRILKFVVRAGWTVTRRHLTGRRYDLIHVHNIPDFLVFAALVPRFTGARVILDIHDIVPEFFVSKFKASPDGMFYRMLRLAERISCGLANHVIIANHLWYEKLTGRSVARANCTTFINYVDVNFFAPRVRGEATHPLRILFPGSLQWHQGLDIAIRAFQGFLKEFPEAEFHIVGDGGERANLVQLTHELGLDARVKFLPLVPTSAVPALISEADMGVVPKRADSFGNEAYSTKIMEYMAQGVPVVVSRTKIDTFYFTDNEVRFFDSGDVQSLTQAMLEVARSPELRERMVRNGWRYVYQNSWNRRKHDYLTLVDCLIDRRPIPDLPANRRPTSAEDAERIGRDEATDARVSPGGR